MSATADFRDQDISNKQRSISEAAQICMTTLSLCVSAPDQRLDTLITSVASAETDTEHVLKIASQNQTKLTKPLVDRLHSIMNQVWVALLATLEDLGRPFDHTLWHPVGNATRVQLSSLGISRIQQRFSIVDELSSIIVQIVNSRKSNDQEPVNLFELSKHTGSNVLNIERVRKTHSPNPAERIAWSSAPAPPFPYEEKLASQLDRALTLPEGSWADLTLVKKWIRQCDEHHTEHCRLSTLAQATFCKRPVWVVDVRRKCLVTYEDGMRYLALSYVWGRQQRGSLMSHKRFLDDMLTEGFFDREQVRKDVAKTIIDAIDLTFLLDEDYLWIDCLCIVQDDPEEMKGQLEAMGSIYANAFVTLVASDKDAGDGLYGIKDAKKPFQRREERSSYLHDAIKQHNKHVKGSAWFRRGWTFQEQILSRRVLVFSQHDVSWECHCAVWVEGLEPTEGLCGTFDQLAAQAPTLATNASLGSFARHVEAYNDRSFSFEDDIVRAFVGILTSLKSSFEGGFACGIPIKYFDIGLLWQTSSPAQRRYITAGKMRDRPALPSWSWMLWLGRLKLDMWNENQHQSLKPLVEWQYKTGLGQEWKPINKSLPQPSTPSVSATDEQSIEPSWELLQCPLYLHGVVTRLFFFIDSIPKDRNSNFRINNRSSAVCDHDGKTAGILSSIRTESTQQTGLKCELVAVSLTTIPVEDMPISKMQEDCEYVNVLWIAWSKGIAYRKGVGQVIKTAWDEEQRRTSAKPIDLVLG